MCNECFIYITQGTIYVIFQMPTWVNVSLIGDKVVDNKRWWIAGDDV